MKAAWIRAACAVPTLPNVPRQFTKDYLAAHQTCAANAMHACISQRREHQKALAAQSARARDAATLWNRILDEERDLEDVAIQLASNPAAYALALVNEFRLDLLVGGFITMIDPLVTEIRNTTREHERRLDDALKARGSCKQRGPSHSGQWRTKTPSTNTRWRLQGEPANSSHYSRLAIEL